MTSKTAPPFLLSALAFLLLCLSAPAYMPGRMALSLGDYQWRLLPLTLVSSGALFLCLRPRRLRSGYEGPAWPWAVAVLSAGLLAADLGMHYVQVGRYRDYGYAPQWPLLITASTAFAAAFLGMAWRGVRDPRAWAGLIVAAWAFGFLFSLSCYPLTTQRSDMLFLLKHGGDAWARGASLSDAYAAPPTTVLTYLPGLWLTYLPATLAGVDLRWASFFGVLASAGLLISSAASSRRPLLLALLAAYLLSPWMQFRHECYVLGMLPFAALASWGVAKGRYWAVLIGCAWMATQSQLAWIALPFMVWHVRLRWGWTASFVLGLGILVALAAVVGPYYVADKADLMRNVFGTWANVFWPESPNFSYAESLLLPLAWLRPLQAGAMVVLFLTVARRSASPRHALAFCALGLALFIAMNTLVRDYFYFYPLLFLAFSMVQDPE